MRNGSLYPSLADDAHAIALESAEHAAGVAFVVSGSRRRARGFLFASPLAFLDHWQRTGPTSGNPDWAQCKCRWRWLERIVEAIAKRRGWHKVGGNRGGHQRPQKCSEPLVHLGKSFRTLR